MPTATALPVEARTPLEKAAGLAMWVPGISWLSTMLGTLMLAQRFFPPDKLDWLSRVYTRGQVLASGTTLRYVVHPDVRPDVTYMFAQNHVNLLDHCTLYGATPHFKQGVELAAHFKLPVYGWFMRQRGTIPVYRDRPLAEMLLMLEASMRAEVSKGHSLLVFPEGTRTRDGRVGRFRSGALSVGWRMGIPIVPVAVTGMFEVLRKGELFIVPGNQVTVYVDEPIRTDDVPEEDLPQLIERVRQVIKGRVDDYYAARAAR